MSQQNPANVRPEPASEIVFLPEPSWKPALVAVGLLAMLAATFMGAIYAIAGLVLALAALIGWIRESRCRFAALPRRQKTVTAVLPPLPGEAVPAPPVRLTDAG